MGASEATKLTDSDWKNIRNGIHELFEQSDSANELLRRYRPFIEYSKSNESIKSWLTSRSNTWVEKGSVQEFSDCITIFRNAKLTPGGSFVDLLVVECEENLCVSLTRSRAVS